MSISLIRATKVRQIPGINVADHELRSVLEAIKENIEVYRGNRGSNSDPLDKAVTVRDLYEAGLTNLNINGILYPGGTVPGGTISPPTGTVPDLTVPPTPTGFTATGAFAMIILQWDDPTLAFSNYAYTEIWRASVDDIGQAVLQGTSQSRFWVDSIGNAATRYYWIRFVSTANPPVIGPYNATSGTVATTATDPAYTLSVLSAAITESELYGALNTRINLIDTPVTGLVDKMTATETATTANATNVSTLTATVGGNTTAIQIESSVRAQSLAPDFSTGSTYNKGDSVVYNSVAYRAKQYVNGGSWKSSEWAVASNVYGQYTVKIDSNSKVIGFGLANDGPGAASDDFIVSADKFIVAAPGGAAGTAIPFIVDTGTGAVIMDIALIKDATITVAKIQNAFMDNLVAAQGTIVDANIGNLSVTKIIGGTTAELIYFGDTTFAINGATKLLTIKDSQGTPVTRVRIGKLGAGTTNYGIEISDQFGNVILSSGGVYASAISNSNQEWADVQDGSLTKPANNADVTILNTSANTNAVGGDSANNVVRAGNKISSSNISTYISSLSADYITAGTLTARTVQTASSGKRMILNSSTNEGEFYGNRGDGGIVKLATIGINSAGGDNTIIVVGGTSSVYTRQGIWVGTYNKVGVYANSIIGTAVIAKSTSGIGLDASGTKAPIRIGNSSASAAPTHSANSGSLWGTSDTLGTFRNRLYYNNTNVGQFGSGTRWANVSLGWAGNVSSGGSWIRRPDLWTITKGSAGIYTITHNLGSAQYIVTASGSQANKLIIVNPYSIGTNSFTVQVYGSGAGSSVTNLQDNQWQFILQLTN